MDFGDLFYDFHSGVLLGMCDDMLQAIRTTLHNMPEFSAKCLLSELFGHNRAE
jgi:hypothetical protein